MARVLLIFALLVPGLGPGLSCDHARDRAETPAFQACTGCCPTDCCQMAECARAQSSPQTPATPPRSGAVAPPLLRIDRGEVDEVPLLSPGLARRGWGARRVAHEQRRFESVVCRWLT